ncbi:DUF4174 domain-containing protein [Vibrio sp. AK197]
MHRFFYVIISMLFATTAWSYPNYTNSWSHRSLLYFAPTFDKQVNEFQLQALKYHCQLEARDVITLILAADGDSEPKWVKEQYNIAQLFVNYDVRPSQHTLILIGKDGQEKLRFDHEVDWPLITQTIDGMPMRQEEMRQRRDPCSV